MAPTNIPIEDINRHLGVVVPEGMRNAQGVRVWRQLIDSLKQVIDDAVANALAAQAAGDAAQTAQGSADSAQGAADTAVAQGVATDASLQALTTAFNDLAADYNGHIIFPATAADLGHVLESATPVAITATAAGAAPAVYTQSHSQDLNDRVEGTIARLNDLISKLQAAGAVA